jgi:hypothetical protein
MNYKCRICGIVQPIELGRQIASGSLVCKDTAVCYARLWDGTEGTP